MYVIDNQKVIVKKALSILLAFVFLLSSSGFSINRHYCGSKLKSTDILLIQNDHISCCGKKEMPKGCCKNETEHIKLKENYAPAQAVDVPASDFITSFVLAFVQTFNFSLTGCDTANFFADSHAPPGKPVSRTILYRSILI